jgi:transposase-like protein
VSNIISLNGTVAHSGRNLGPERSEGERSETERSSGPKFAPPDPEVPVLQPRRRFTQAYKERILHEAENCRETRQIASLLRREGLYSSHLAAWRKQIAEAPKRRGRKPLDAAFVLQREENRKLQREKARLERRLAQAEAIIDIQKKLSELLGIPLSPIESDGND